MSTARRFFAASVPLVVLALAATAAALLAPAHPLAQSLGARPPTGGRYAELAADQQRLFDDVLRRYNAIARTQFTPAAGYEAMPMSRRTTFEAVTHALGATTMTDASGAPLGSALDLVSAIDEIAGETRGARGDRQFRLYVLLGRDAVDRLTRAREFVRTADNTIYHPGYPVSFRLRGGTPSVQVSVSRDGQRGDIDVDYRSSGFPVALFNGHLTTANSDVRAGGNFDRHQGRWDGLGNWWRGLLEFFASSPADAVPDSTRGVIPVQPRQPSRARIEAVVEDFLQAWLVEGRPELAAAYYAPLSFGCLVAPADASAGEGLERYRVLERMKAANAAIGTVNALSQASLSVNPWHRGLEVVRHRREPAFLLVRVPSALATAYDCANRTGAAPTLEEGREYFASAFRLRIPGGPAPVLVMLWAREPAGFRIVATDIEEAAEPSLPIGGPARGPTATSSRARAVAGPPALVEATTAFHRAWFVDRDSTRALAYVDDAGLECLPVVSGGAMPATRASMRALLDQVTARTASRGSLAAAIRGNEQALAGGDVVRHAERAAFTLVPVADAFASAVACGAELPTSDDGRPARPAGTATGSAVSYFQLNLPGDPAFIWMLWRSGPSGWRIHYWTVVMP